MTSPPPFTGKTPLVITARNKHTATLIFSHGLGDTADGWLGFAKDLSPQFPHVKWILTNAPRRYIKLWDESMPSWWDFKVRNAPPQDEDSQGMLQSVETIKQSIEIEVANGIDPGRIVVGGFSQGSVLSILTTVTSTRPLAGTLALSGYLALTYENHINTLATDVGRNIPMLMAHGDQDAVITLDKNQRGYDHLKSIGFDKINYRVYKGLAHSLGQQETLDIVEFLNKVIP